MLHTTTGPRAENAAHETTATLPVLMDQRRAAAYLGVSVKWLERDRWIGATIAYVKIGRAVRYRATDLAAFVDRNLITGGAK